MRILGITALLLSVTLSASMAVLLTEAGQLLNVPLDWPLAALANRLPVAIICLVALLLGLVIAKRQDILGTGKLVLVSVAVIALLLSALFIMPYFFFPTKQHDAQFLPIAQVDAFLQPQQDVVVLELGDQVHALPTNMLWQPHVAGVSVGAEEVAVTYCVLTNSSVAFSPVIGGEKAELKVLMQAHNNLVLFDEKSGQSIQQIERSTVAGEALDTRPTQMMSWQSFKEIYPQGKVFFNPYNSLREKFIDIVFGLPLRDYPNPERDEPMFPTLDLADARLPNKEKVWGIAGGDDALAISRDYFRQQPVINETVGGIPVVIAYYPEYGTVGGFSRELNGEVLQVTEIDVYGNTPQGKLRRIDMFSEVYWMVWAHFHPGARLLMAGM
jgi:hypothetical protein